MMYRCGWATKPGQERVLAVEIRRDGFEWALANSALSHFDRGLHPDERTWARLVKAVGLSGEAVTRYTDEWIVAITDITATVKEMHADPATTTPTETVHPLPPAIAARIGADPH